MELAAGRRVHRAGDVPREDDPRIEVKSTFDPQLLARRTKVETLFRKPTRPHAGGDEELIGHAGRLRRLMALIPLFTSPLDRFPHRGVGKIAKTAEDGGFRKLCYSN